MNGEEPKWRKAIIQDLVDRQRRETVSLKEIILQRK